MEQKKLLLVAISVGVFLVIAIGAAILVLGTGKQAPGIASAFPISPGPAYFIPGESAYGDSYHSGSEYSADNGIGTSANNAPEILSSVNSSREISDPEKSADSAAFISVSRPSTTAVPDAPPSGRAVSSGQAAARTTPAAAAPKPAVSSTAAPAKASTVVAAPKPAAPRTYNNYWVQTGSFTAKSRAEGVKETLAAKGISSIIENRDVDGTTFFRVRVGPYTSKNEADYWLSLIQSINGFESSQIWQSQTIN